MLILPIEQKACALREGWSTQRMHSQYNTVGNPTTGGPQNVHLVTEITIPRSQQDLSVSRFSLVARSIHGQLRLCSGMVHRLEISY